MNNTSWIVVLGLSFSMHANAKIPRASECGLTFQQIIYKTFTSDTKKMVDGFQTGFIQSDEFLKMHPKDAINAIRGLDAYSTFYFAEEYSKKYPEVQKILSAYREKVQSISNASAQQNATKAIKAQLTQWVDTYGWTTEDVLKKYEASISEIIDKVSPDELSKALQTKDYFSVKLSPAHHQYSGGMQTSWEKVKERYQDLTPSEKKRFDFFASQSLYKKLIELDNL